MKKIIISVFSFLSVSLFSQVIIGDEVGTAIDKTSVLLEFANTNNKGIIISYVRTLPANPEPGTLLLDVSDATKARIKYYSAKDVNEPWEDLSGKDADVTAQLSIQSASITENATAKAIIGSPESLADGALVLESNDKAMVLPIVDDVNNIPSPSPGMLVYINKSGAKRLAVFNGNTWAFWQEATN